MAECHSLPLRGGNVGPRQARARGRGRDGGCRQAPRRARASHGELQAGPRARYVGAQVPCGRPLGSLLRITDPKSPEWRPGARARAVGSGESAVSCAQNPSRVRSCAGHGASHCPSGRPRDSPELPLGRSHVGCGRGPRLEAVLGDHAHGVRSFHALCPSIGRPQRRADPGSRIRHGAHAGRAR
jgi:hypothetical protein